MSKEYGEFTKQIKQKLGIHLNLYKEAQMKRRITSLRNKRGFKTFPSYYAALNNDDVLLNEFIDRLTINVSEFYRNPKRWDVLKDKILPLLINKKNHITIWSAACSTGEEPYSLAMVLNHYFPSVHFRILATDFDEKVLDWANQGIYQEKALKDLPLTLKHKYFTKQHGLYQIDPLLKKNITFKQHDLLADSYPENIDLLVCRNVLIYFTDQAKDIIYKNFSNALTTNSVLFVGSTEQIFSPNKYDLSLIDTFFYQKL